MNVSRLLSIVLAASSCLYAATCVGREFTDKTGQLKFEGTMIAADDKEIVLKLDGAIKGRELLAIKIEDLSEEDKKWLASEESHRELASAYERQSWKLRNGLEVFGHIVDFARKDITLQRRRGKLYVNDRPFDNLPEIYRKMIPKIVAHFENRPIENDAQFQSWVLAQRANARTFSCEGVLFEFPNGDEYGIPFFFFEADELKVLEPYWQKWLETHGSSDQEKALEEQRQHSLYMQSEANAMQQYQQEMLELSRLQLQMNAVAAGVTSMWEVFLYPPAGVWGQPISVVVVARNSDEASQMAIFNNPGFVLGPVRRLGGGRFRW
ncbi:MAG: hypothetical protein MUF23_18085 [Pirellula sp.]|jgi:hypothetical protein|nr:hypothetical protein [Pirellula sp.]